GAWTDQTHLPPGHVEQLRKLVQRPPPQPRARTSPPVHALDSARSKSVARAEHPHRWVTAHGPKLQDVKRTVIPPDPALAKQHRAGRAALDQERDGCQQ